MFFQCHCLPGTYGDNCEINVNECASNPCLNQGQCVDKINGFECRCKPGYRGVKCESICDRGRFGTNCQGLCDCDNGSSCDPQFGKKEEKVKIQVIKVFH